MSKKLLAVFGFVGLFVLLFGFVGVGNAQEFRHGANATVATTETVDSSAYMAGRNIDVAGDINGDLYCAGQTINISGTIHGDIICAGQTITISGNVDGDVRLAGQSIVISSNIANNATIAAQNFTLNGTGRIGQDVTGGVDTMTINGSIGRDLLLGASTATINGTVGRNIKSELNDLSLGSMAKVGGNISYTSHNQLNKDSGAIVAGTITQSEPKQEKSKDGWFGIGFRIYWFLAMLLVALVLVLLFPRIFENSAQRTIKSFGRTLLIGVAATLLTPLVVGLLAATLVGLPLGLLLLMAWILGLVLSGPFVAYLIGKEVWRAQRNAIWTMLVGTVLLLLIYNIPFLGFIVMLAVVFVGMGMVVREVSGRTPKPIYVTKK